MYVFLCARKGGEREEEGERKRERVYVCVCTLNVTRIQDAFSARSCSRKIKLDTNNWSNSFRELFLFNMRFYCRG